MPILVFLLFCAEVAALIGLGGVIGGWFVLLEILATGFIGYLIIKRAGRAILRSDRLIALIARPVSGIYNLGLSVVLAFRRRPPRRREEERVIDVEFSVQEEGRE